MPPIAYRGKFRNPEPLDQGNLLAGGLVQTPMLNFKKKIGTLIMLKNVHFSLMLPPPPKKYNKIIEFWEISGPKKSTSRFDRSD